MSDTPASNPPFEAPLKQTTKGRILWIDILRGEAILLTIIGHLILCGLINYKFFSWIYLFHMPLFFFVSGCIPFKEMTLFQWLHKRTKTLLIPYFVLGGVYLIIQYFLWRHYSRTWELMPSIIHYLTGLSIGPLWFLPTLFFVELLFWSIHRISKGEVTMMILVIILGVLGHVINVNMPRDEKGICINLPWHLNAVPIMLGFFYLGNRFHTIMKFHSWTKRPIVLVFLAGGCLFLTIFSLFHNSQIDINYGWYGKRLFFFYPCAMCGIILSWIMAVCVERYDTFGFLKKVLVFIGQNTLILVAFHTLILLIVGHFVRIFLPNVLILQGPLSVLLTIALLSPITIAVKKYIPCIIGQGLTLPFQKRIRK